MQLKPSGYQEIQSFRLPIVRVGYFDTRGVSGVATDIVGAKPEGHEPPQADVGEFLIESLN